MASLTVRQLDERLKKLLRLRAASSGRSVEDEVRTILRERPTDRAETLEPSAGLAVDSRARPAHAAPAGQARPADHRRRHRRLQVARPDPPAEGARHRRAHAS